MASCSSRRMIRPVPKVSLRSCPFGLGNSARAVTIRVCWSAVVLIQTSFPLTSPWFPSGRKRTGCPKASLPASSTETFSVSHIRLVSANWNNTREASTTSPATTCRATMMPSIGAFTGRRLAVVSFGTEMLYMVLGKAEQSEMLGQLLVGQPSQLLDVHRQAEIGERLLSAEQARPAWTYSVWAVWA